MDGNSLIPFTSMSGTNSELIMILYPVFRLSYINRKRTLCSVVNGVKNGAVVRQLDSGTELNPKDPGVWKTEGKLPN